MLTQLLFVQAWLIALGWTYQHVGHESHHLARGLPPNVAFNATRSVPWPQLPRFCPDRHHLPALAEAWDLQVPDQLVCQKRVEFVNLLLVWQVWLELCTVTDCFSCDAGATTRTLWGRRMRRWRTSNVSGKPSSSWGPMCKSSSTSSATMPSGLHSFRVKSKCSRNCETLFNFDPLWCEFAWIFVGFNKFSWCLDVAGLFCKRWRKKLRSLCVSKTSSPSLPLPSSWMKCLSPTIQTAPFSETSTFLPHPNLGYVLWVYGPWTSTCRRAPLLKLHLRGFCRMQVCHLELRLTNLKFIIGGRERRW